MVEIRNVYKILVVNSEGKRLLEDIEADWRLKLKLTLNQSICQAVGSVYLGRVRFNCLLNTAAMSEPHE
jgi:predicted HTH domain antitoxin